MKRNEVIGILLIMLTFFLWTLTTKPSKEELEKSKRMRDSIALAEQNILPENQSKTVLVDTLPKSNDTTASEAAHLQFGAFSTAASGKEEFPVLENDKIRVTFSSKGGRIVDVLLKQHYKTVTDSNNNDSKELIHMLNSPENRFDYTLSVPSALNKEVNTKDLYFQVDQQGNTISFKAPASGGGYFEQRFTLQPDQYILDYSLRANGLAGSVSQDKPMHLNWINHLSKYEKAANYEQSLSTVYFREKDQKTDYCRCISDATEELPNKPIQWVAHANQFFNSALMTKNQPFVDGVMTTKMTDVQKSDYVKIVTSEVGVPITDWNNSSFDMTMYIGPNEFKTLRSFNNKLEEIIPFGSSIFGSINRWVIRPFFDFLSGFISSKGIVILVLIFIIKMALYPLMYKMLHSQAKMAALKPELAQLKEKYKDDMQKQQMETMKIYREFGVSPFGGCLPMLLQMPIWYALFRFFPASITFRQEPFLWAPDLSTYDVFFHLGFNIPYFGDHVSLFTLLWTLSTIAYTYYNSQNMDMSANPAMKYVQYFMPLLFLGFFNNYASGLTAYMFFSNLINVLQTIITKNYVFDEEKIRQELLAEKAKPKKKSSFQSRLEEAMKQQQAMQEQKRKKK